MTVLESIATTAVTAVLAAVIGARLALFRYRSERLWDRKLEAYVNLLESLFYIRSYSARTVETIEEGGSLNSEYMGKLGKKSSAGYEAVKKAAAVGTVLLSAEAADRLRQLEEEFDVPQYNMDIHEAASTDLSIAISGIKDLRAIAARDLKIPKT